MRTLFSKYSTEPCCQYLSGMQRLTVSRCFKQKCKIIRERRTNHFSSAKHTVCSLVLLVAHCSMCDTDLWLTSRFIPAYICLTFWIGSFTDPAWSLFWFSPHPGVTNYQIVLLAFGVVRVADTWPFCQLVPPGFQLFRGLRTLATVWIEPLNIPLPVDSARVLLDI